MFQDGLDSNDPDFLAGFDINSDNEIITLVPGFEIEVDPKIFNRSAWRNRGLDFFPDTKSCTDCLKSGDDGDYLNAIDAGLHFYEVVDKGRDLLGSVNEKTWNRFLAAGPNPNLDNGDYHHNEEVDHVELAYCDLLLCASWIADVKDKSEGVLAVKRLKEAGFSAAIHILERLDPNKNLDEADNSQTAKVLSRLTALSEEENTPQKLKNVLNEMISSVGLLSANLALLREEYGELGDEALKQRDSEDIVEAATKSAKNHALFMSMQSHIIDHVTQATWESADSHALELKHAAGGHLSCCPSWVRWSKRLRQATFGMLNELDRSVDRILLVGGEWISPLTEADPKKRGPVELMSLINNWLTLSRDSVRDCWLDHYLEMSDLDTESVTNAIEAIGELYRIMDDRTCELLFYMNTESIPKTDVQTVVVGSNDISKFFNGEHYSIQVSTTSQASDINFYRDLEDIGASIYLEAAVFEAQRRFSGFGIWNTALIPGPVIADLEEQKLTDLPTHKKFSDFHRLSCLPEGKPYASKFHNAYVFVCSSKGDPVHQLSEDPADVLLKT